MKFSFFDLPKPKRFNYKPRYYNAQKDELEQRIKAHELSKEQTEEERLRIKMKNDWERELSKRKVTTKSNRMTLWIMIALVALILYILLR